MNVTKPSKNLHEGRIRAIRNNPALVPLLPVSEEYPVASRLANGSGYELALHLSVVPRPEILLQLAKCTDRLDLIEKALSFQPKPPSPV